MTSLLCLSLATVAASQSVISLKPAANVPVGASKRVDPSFPSFAIQGSSFAAYTGNASHPNILSRNLIQGIENRTCGALVVRVGGTNTDYSNYNPDQAVPVDPPQNGAGIGQKFVFGPSFYEGFQNWPGTRWVYDVPFAKQNHTDSFYEAQAAIKNIGLSNLDALEIGNEVDLYVKQGSRNSSWSPAAYAAQFHTYSDWLVGALNLPSGRLFDVLTLSGAHSGDWTAENVFKAGITNGGRVKSVSLHHYEHTNTATAAGLQSTLMNHTFVEAGVNNYTSDLQYLQKNHPDVQIIFGESGRYAPNMSSVDNGQGVFGAGLWTADYLLYLMTQNVTRVNMQLGQVFGYVAWHPINFDGLTPGVRSPYFGHLLVADFMGCSKNFRAVEVKTDDPALAVYAGYDNGKLARVVVINYDVWTGSGTRPSRKFNVSVPCNIKSAKVSTMTSPGGAMSLGYFYWAGLAFSYANHGVGTLAPEQPQPYNVQASKGQISVTVGSSNAVLIDLS